MARNYIGVDLSRQWLDIFDPRAGAARIPNCTDALRDWIGGLGPDDLVVFESTSLCDEPIRRVASEVGQPFHRLNPLHGWHFGRSLNLPKTDAVDARMLARIGAARRLAARPIFDATRAELAELTGRRDQLKRLETQEKNRLHKASSGTVRADIETALHDLARRLRRIEAAIAAFIGRHPDLDRKARLLTSIPGIGPGIGPVTASILIALMPELGSLRRKQIASLGGLAPRARDSGRWRGHRYIGDGRRHVRCALYMAAVSQMRKTSPFHSFVQALRDKGKPGKVIAIAVARKLLTIANAVLRDNTPCTAPGT